MPALINNPTCRALFAAVALFATSNSVYGQGGNCASALIQDVKRIHMSDAHSLAIAELFYRERGRDKNWAADVTVPIEGVPVGGGAESAERTREQYFRESNLDWSSERLRSVATQRLSKNSVEAYRACIEGKHKFGPRIIVHDARKDAATVTISWLAAPGQASSAQAAYDITGAKFRQSPPSRWNNNESRSFIIVRDPDADVRIVANIGGSGDNVFISRWPKAPVVSKPTPKPVLIMAYCFGHGGQEGVRLWGPKDASCNLLTPPNWGPYDGSPQEVTSLGSCVGGGGFNGVTLWGPTGDVCGGIPAWGRYNGSVDITRTGIGHCMHHGNMLGGHHFWGPFNEICGGIPDWGRYSEGRLTSNSTK